MLAAVCFLLGALLIRPTTSPISTQAGEDEIPDVLRAHQIELVDEAGQVRGSMKVEEGGEAVFRLLGEKGTIRVKLGASEEGSGLLLIDDRTEPAVHMLAKPDGTRITLAEEGKEQKVITP
jgi:hypothetical protein